MSRTKKVLSAITITLGMVVAALGVTSGTAQAATYGGQCGNGYSVIDHANLGSLGTVFLTINSSGTNCVVTIRNNPDARMFMNALVSLEGRPWIDDPGNWTTYAGPVFVSAPHQCIDWGGVIAQTSYYEYGVHCG